MLFLRLQKKLEYDSVAQLVEHNTFNVGVLGSNPSGITEASLINSEELFCYFVFQFVHFPNRMFSISLA